MSSSHRTSTSQSASQSASTSASTSQSASQSASASASTSQSASQSASTSESASQSASISASAASVASNNGGGSGSGSSTPSSASESSQAAPSTTGQNPFDEVVNFAEDDISITSTIDFNEVQTTPARTNASANTANTTRFNEVDRNHSIEDEQVPLAVVLDKDADDVVVIKDDETPLGIAKSGAGARVWWYWILIVISAVSGKVAKDKRKAKANAVENFEEK